MNVIVPYVEGGLHPTVPFVLEDVYGFRAEFWRMNTDEDYWRLGRHLWTRDNGDTVIVEQDILPWPGAVEEMLDCPALWCSLTYHQKIGPERGGYGIYHSFGCTKFSAELIRQIPDVWESMEDKTWHLLDAQFSLYALARGIMPHPHRPPAIHLKKI